MSLLCLLSVGCLSWFSAIETDFTVQGTMPSDSSTSWRIPHKSDAFDALWLTMDSMQFQGNGSLSCLYIGGSHVQAGWLGHGIRKRFEDSFPSSDTIRGWLLPYRMAQTDTPTHFRTESTGKWTGMRCTHGGHVPPFGIAGIRAHTEDPAATWQHVSIRSDSTLHAAEAIEVYGDALGCIPSWLGEESLHSRQALVNGTGWLFQFEDPVDTVRFGLDIIESGAISFDLFATTQRLMPHQDMQFTLYEWGNNGAKVSSALRCDAWASEWPLPDLDIVFLGLGINDVHAAGSSGVDDGFAHAYDSLVQRIQNMAPNAALVLLSNTDSMKNGQSMRARSKQVQAIQEKIALSHGCATFDLGKAMEDIGSIMDWHDAGLAQADLIHFTPSGYDKLADLLFSSWIEANKNRPTSIPEPSSQER